MIDEEWGQEARALINRTHLCHNVKWLQQCLPKTTQLFAVIKADAYGHGLLEVARTLRPFVAGFSVARLSEAQELRQQGILDRIMVFAGAKDLVDWQHAAEKNIELSIHRKEQVEQLLNNKLTSSIRVWLKVETGLNRTGLSSELLQHYWPALQAHPQVQECVLYSHFSQADETELDVTTHQIQYFKQVSDSLFSSTPCKKSLGASSGILFWPDSHLDIVRAGITLYGVSPKEKTTGADLGFRPVMTLQAPLLSIRQVAAGEKVGYGGRWQAPTDRYIAVIGFGYGDGYPREIQEGTPVAINGIRYPIVGRVSMDMITVDLGEKRPENIQIGDWVELWGVQIPVELIAEQAKTIPYVLLTQLSKRVTRHYTDKFTNEPANNQ